MTWTGDAYNPDEDAEHERELKQHGMEPDADKYEGHLASEGQTWAWSKWMLNNAETIEQHEATSALLNDAPLLLEEVKRLRKDRDLLWDAIRLSGTGGNQEEEIAFWHEKLLNMNEAELKEAFKGHYEEGDD